MSSVFLRRGVTMACRCDTGNRPWANDALTIAVRHWRRTSTYEGRWYGVKWTRPHRWRHDDAAYLGQPCTDETTTVISTCFTDNRRWRHTGRCHTDVVDFLCNELRESVSGMAGSTSDTAEHAALTTNATVETTTLGWNWRAQASTVPSLSSKLHGDECSSDPRPAVFSSARTVVLAFQSATLSTQWTTFRSGFFTAN